MFLILIDTRAFRELDARDVVLELNRQKKGGWTRNFSHKRVGLRTKKKCRSSTLKHRVLQKQERLVSTSVRLPMLPLRQPGCAIEAAAAAALPRTPLRSGVWARPVLERLCCVLGFPSFFFILLRSCSSSSLFLLSVTPNCLFLFFRNASYRDIDVSLKIASYCLPTRLLCRLNARGKPTWFYFYLFFSSLLYRFFSLQVRVFNFLLHNW